MSSWWWSINHYNFKKMAGALLGSGTLGGLFSGGLATPGQTFQKRSTPQPKISPSSETTDTPDHTGTDASKEEEHQMLCMLKEWAHNAILLIQAPNCTRIGWAGELSTNRGGSHWQSQWLGFHECPEVNEAQSGHNNPVSDRKCMSCTGIKKKNSAITQTGQKTTRNHPFTVSWVLQRVSEDSVEKTKTHLQVWAPKRYKEYSKDFMMESWCLKQSLGVKVLKKLKWEKGFIRGMKRNSLIIETIIQDLEGVPRTTAKTLIDSGSTGL